MTDTLINVENLGKKFKLYKRPIDRVIEWVSRGTYQRHEETWVLKNITFSLRRGESIGIIGPNGAGKSTLLKILSRALWPTEGSFTVNGNMVSLLELGTGFHPELTGIENIFNSGELLGFSMEFLENKIEDIVAFAELGEYIDHPVKTYSSGMYVRLAFSLFANLEPEIYIVDEALSVGDIFFQQKCFRFLQTLKQKGTAIIVVSHDMQTVMKYCDRVFILQNGKITHRGNPVDMVNLYYTLSNSAKMTSDDALMVQEGDALPQNKVFNIEGQHHINNAKGLRRGTGEIEILGARLINENGMEISTVATGDYISLEIYAKAHYNVNDLTIGFQITDRMNTVVFGQNAYMLTKKKLRAAKGEILKATFRIHVSLFQGLYTFMVCATENNLEAAKHVYDCIEGCLLLEVVKPKWRSFHGIAELKSSFEIYAYKEEIINGEKSGQKQTI